MLVLSLQQVDVSVVYSDAGVLGPLSPEARSRVMQGTRALPELSVLCLSSRHMHFA